jgi:hypothetical protein
VVRAHGGGNDAEDVELQASLDIEHHKLGIE